jgi:hypothetical protein
MLQFRTQGFNGSAVKYSPFFDNRLAVATAANFGLVGNGRLYMLELTPNGIVPLKQYVESHLHAPLPRNERGYKSDIDGLGSPPKMLSTTSPGPKSTRTRS